MDTSYAESYFGKPLREINQNDVKSFFLNPQEETETIEFKSFFENNSANYSHKENAVLKTICAFLNSGGGLLIWGAPSGELDSQRNIKTFTGELSPVGVRIEKDSFISKIANRIIPLSNLINFHSIEVGDSKYIYLFDVQQSISRPHRFDDKYWIRMDGQTKVAPHHIVEALFKQISFPILGGYIKFEKCKLIYNQNAFLIFGKIFIFNHSKNQNEFDIYFSLSISQGKLRAMSRDSEIGIFSNKYQTYRREEVSKILSYSHAPYHDFCVELPHSFCNNLENKLEIMLTFGGRTSPMKKSEYLLQVDDTSILNLNFEDKTKNVFRISESLNEMMNTWEEDEDKRVRFLLDQ